MELVTVGEIDRSTYIGGSDIAAILGVSPWMTPLKLYQKKIGQLQEEESAEKLAVLRRGQRWEPIARDMLLDSLEGIYGKRPGVINTNERYRHAEFPHLAAEIDMEIQVDNDVRNVEIKTVHPFRAHEWGEEGSDEVPVHYTAQAMFGLAVMGRKRAVVGALFGADAMVPYEIERDDEVIETMIAKANTFWFDHVLKRVPPEPVNMDDIKRIMGGLRGRPVEVDDDLLNLIKQYRVATEKAKALKADVEALQFSICNEIRKAWGVPLSEPDDGMENAVLLLGGREVASWKKQRGTYLDQKAIWQEVPEVAAKHTVEHYFRVLRLKKTKE